MAIERLDEVADLLVNPQESGFYSFSAGEVWAAELCHEIAAVLREEEADRIETGGGPYSKKQRALIRRINEIMGGDDE